MPNNYLTVQELKDRAVDGYTGGVTQYDELFFTLANALSRWADEKSERIFYPYLATRYYDGDNETDFDIDALISITSLSFSDDNGATYTALAATDYILMPNASDYSGLQSYTVIRIDDNGEYSVFPKGQKSIKLIGTFGYSEDRDNVWQDTGDTVQDNPLSSSATALTFTDIDGADKFGYTPRVDVGQLLRIEDEFIEVTAVNITTQVGTIVRGVNGTTAVAHVQTTQIDKFIPPPTLKDAVIIQATRQFKRGQAGFGDTEGLINSGKLLHIKTEDPMALGLLQHFKELGFT